MAEFSSGRKPGLLGFEQPALDPGSRGCQEPFVPAVVWAVLSSGRGEGPALCVSNRVPESFTQFCVCDGACCLRGPFLVFLRVFERLLLFGDVKVPLLYQISSLWPHPPPLSRPSTINLPSLQIFSCVTRCAHMSQNLFSAL